MRGQLTSYTIHMGNYNQIDQKRTPTKNSIRNIIIFHSQYPCNFPLSNHNTASYATPGPFSWGSWSFQAALHDRAKLGSFWAGKSSTTLLLSVY